jgi:poly-beta-1,6-N-acetyl-D-glucosamine N-deacetylase
MPRQADKTRVNTVFVQAFRGNEGMGGVKSLYYYNDVLPVAMDFLSHAVNRIKGRGIQTFVWMPLFGISPPDRTNGDVSQTPGSKPPGNGAVSFRKNLSPFDTESLAVSRRIFRDVAAYVDFDGVLIQDDTYFTGREDSEARLETALVQALGTGPIAGTMACDAIRTQWVELKTDATNAYVSEMVKTIRTYRPTAKIARTIYGEGLTDPGYRKRFDRDLGFLLQNFDYTLIMAHPDMQKKTSRTKIRNWMKEMASRLKSRQGADKAIFLVQAFDGKKHRWIDERILSEELSSIIALGAKHVAYYPDGVVEDKPRRDDIASIISGQEFIRGVKNVSVGIRR